MSDPCHHQWLTRQGLPPGEAEPCGHCVLCEHRETRSADLAALAGHVDGGDVAAVAGQVHAAIAKGDLQMSDRLIRHAVHLGVSPTDLFLAGGPPAADEATGGTDADTSGERRRSGRQARPPAD